MCNLWIMPNPGDAGASLGAALLPYGDKIVFNPYLGYDIQRNIDPKEVVDALLQKGICGIANGPAEFGPRALGNRSLLADPRTLEMKDKVNEIKKRQKFRPFAPVILEEHCQDYFDMPYESRYMSYVYNCKRPQDIPACVHVDNSARVQTVPTWSSSTIREILECWYERTGCPVILNTSLNIRGMPIVNTWKDAKEFSNTYQVEVF
jgi:carbamoyltransferase